MTPTGGNEQRAPTAVVAAVVTFFVLGLPALALTGIGLGQYTEHYCSTLDEFAVLRDGSGSISGPRFAGPFRLECESDGLTVSRFDFKPALWVIIVWGGVLAGSTFMGLGVGLLPGRRSPSGPWDGGHA